MRNLISLSCLVLVVLIVTGVFPLNIRYKQPKLNYLIDEVQKYNKELDALGRQYQLKNGAIYVEWYVDDDRGLFFEFMNKNNNTYFIGYQTLLNSMEE